MTINTFQPLTNLNVSNNPSTSTQKKRIIKARAARIEGKIHLNRSHEGDHKPWVEVISEGDVVTGAVIHCTCGSSMEIQFDYGNGKASDNK